MDKEEIVAEGMKVCLRDVLAILPKSPLGGLTNIKEFMAKVRDDDKNNHLIIALEYVYDKAYERGKSEG